MKRHAQAAVARSRTRQAVMVAVLVGLIAAAGFGFRGFRKHKVTAPAVSYVSATTTAPGMVAQILVRPGQQVRKGELLAVMDFGELEAQREEAQQDVLNAVEGGAAGNQAIATPAPAPGITGGIDKRIVPVGKLPPPMPMVRSNNIQAPDGSAAPPALATLPKAGSPGDAGQADSKAKDLQSKIKLEEDAIRTLQKSFADEQDAATSAQDLVNSLAAAAGRTRADSDKSATLLAEGVISANDAAKSQTYAQQAEGQLEDARVHAAAAEATLGDTQREIDKTAKQVLSDREDLKKVQAEADEARKHPALAPATPAERSPQPVPKFKLVPIPSAAGPVAPPTPVHVDFLPPALEGQRIDQAEAKLDAVGQRFSGACIYAPADGVIERIAIRPGQTVQANAVAVVIRKG